MKKNTNIFDKLRQLPLFLGMNQEDIALVAGSTKFDFTTLEADEDIVKEGEPCDRLWFLLNGKVMTTACADDHSYKITEYIDAPNVLQPEHIFGLHQYYTRSFKTVTACNMMSISRNEVVKLTSEQDIFRINVLNMMAYQSQKLQRQLWHKKPSSLEQRIINFITDRCMYPAGRKVISIAMSCLAKELNDTRLNISKALNHFQQLGLIKLNRKLIEIDHLEELIRYKSTL